MAETFYENKFRDLPLCTTLVEKYPLIRNEVLEFISNYDPLIPFPKYKVNVEQVELYDNDWKAFPLSVFRDEAPEITNDPRFLSLVKFGKEKCPVIHSIIEDLEKAGELANVFISKLTPGTIIRPHFGRTPHWMRFHLGLVDDPKCYIKVGSDSKSWESGKILAFRDGGEYPHEVVHKGTRDRIILSMDVKMDYLAKWLKNNGQV